MKKYLFVLVFIFLLCLPISAYSGELLVDSEGLLTDDERNKLSDLLYELSDYVESDIAVVTVESFDGMSAQAYAEAFYDGVGYGRGEYSSGILLLVSVREGQYFISTNGYPYHAIDSYEMDDIENVLLDGLSRGDYYTAFVDFATLAADAADTYDYYEGTPNGDSDTWNIWYTILISVGIGFVISFILVTVKKAKMTTVKPVNTASNYIVNNSLNLTHQSDRYLYSTVTRTKKSSSTSGSRSSSHGRSGGGFSGRGGRGGRF